MEANRNSKARGFKWLDSITRSVDVNWSKRRELVERRGPWHAAVHGAEKSWTQLRDPTAAAARTVSEPQGASEEPRRTGGFYSRAACGGGRKGPAWRVAVGPTARLAPEDKGENRSY